MGRSKVETIALSARRSAVFSWCKWLGSGGTRSTVPTTHDDGSITLVVEALRLAKELCLDLEARTSIVEACLLRLVERLETMGFK